MEFLTKGRIVCLCLCRVLNFRRNPRVGNAKTGSLPASHLPQRRNNELMPTLNWIGKDAVVNHHLQVPFHLLRDVPALACGAPGSGNLVVEGDNLLALKALLPTYAGQVSCIYIYP